MLTSSLWSSGDVFVVVGVHDVVSRPSLHARWDAGSAWACKTSAQSRRSDLLSLYLPLGENREH